MLQRTLPAGFIAPCLPTKTDKLPSGSQWLHEIKHDGFRIIARKNGAQVRLYSRSGNDLTRRFPLIVETLARSCVVEEALIQSLCFQEDLNASSWCMQDRGVAERSSAKPD
jgi:ATP-dependent DNA ligase